MPLDLRPNRTVTGKTELIVGGVCEWSEFPLRAQAAADHFGLAVTERTDGLDERMWITGRGAAQFCISWDIWSREVSIMAWAATPDAEVERLATGA